MSVSARIPADETLAIDVSRRSACAILGLGTMLLGRRAFATDKSIEFALGEQYGLMRRAYQTGNAELLRQSTAMMSLWPPRERAPSLVSIR